MIRSGLVSHQSWQAMFNKFKFLNPTNQIRLFFVVVVILNLHTITS